MLLTAVFPLLLHVATQLETPFPSSLGRLVTLCKQKRSAGFTSLAYTKLLVQSILSSPQSWDLVFYAVKNDAVKFTGRRGKDARLLSGLVKQPYQF